MSIFNKLFIDLHPQDVWLGIRGASLSGAGRELFLGCRLEKGLSFRLDGKFTWPENFAFQVALTPAGQVSPASAMYPAKTYIFFAASDDESRQGAQVSFGAELPAEDFDTLLDAAKSGRLPKTVTLVVPGDLKQSSQGFDSFIEFQDGESHQYPTLLHRISMPMAARVAQGEGNDTEMLLPPTRAQLTRVEQRLAQSEKLTRYILGVLVFITILLLAGLL